MRKLDLRTESVHRTFTGHLLVPRSPSRTQLYRSQRCTCKRHNYTITCNAAMISLGNPVLLGTGILVLTAFTAATISAKRRSKLPELFMQQTAFNRAVLSRCPTINSLYDFFPLVTLNGYVLCKSPTGIDWLKP